LFILDRLNNIHRDVCTLPASNETEKLNAIITVTFSLYSVSTDKIKYNFTEVKSTLYTGPYLLELSDSNKISGMQFRLYHSQLLKNVATYILVL
jgi:hypothetical protein